MLHFTRRFDLF